MASEDVRKTANWDSLSDIYKLKIATLIQFSLLYLSMLFIIHLTLNIWNISNQNVFLYVFWHFLGGEV